MWDADSCLDALQMCADHLGRPPAKHEYDTLYSSGKLGDVPSSGTIQYQLGWNTAKERLDMDTVEQHENTCVVDEEYFATIDTDTKAYWLGFIFCDGHLRPREEYSGWSFRLALQQSDRAHVESFAEDVASSYTIADRDGTGEGGPCTELNITNRVFGEHLAARGMAVTDRAPYPDVPESHQQACLRGMFDADGSFGTDPPSLRFLQKRRETVDWWADGVDSCTRDSVHPNRYESDEKWYAAFTARATILSTFYALWLDADGPRLARKEQLIREYLEQED